MNRQTAYAYVDLEEKKVVGVSNVSTGWRDAYVVTGYLGDCGIFLIKDDDRSYLGNAAVAVLLETKSAGFEFILESVYEERVESERAYDRASADVVVSFADRSDAVFVADALALLAGIDEGENTDYERLLRLEQLVRAEIADSDPPAEEEPPAEVYEILLEATGDRAEAADLEAALVAARTLVDDVFENDPRSSVYSPKRVRNSLTITKGGRYDGLATGYARDGLTEVPS